jgi:hypothetical protein
MILFNKIKVSKTIITVFISLILFLILVVFNQPVFLSIPLIFITVAVTFGLLSPQVFKLKISLFFNSKIVNYLLVILSICFLILDLLSIKIDLFVSIYFLLFITFLPGFVLLKLINFSVDYSKLEILALVFPVSIAIFSMAGVIILFLPFNVRGLALASIVISISAISLIKDRKNSSQKIEFTLDNPKIILFLILFFFIFILGVLYVNISNKHSFDIAQNYIQALAFTKNFGAFSSPSSEYPIFSIFQSLIFYFSYISPTIFQVIMYLGILPVILTFYIMAKQYLPHYSALVPVVATLIWALFAGFGWLSFLSLNVGNQNSSFVSLIGQANSISYGDLTWRRLFFYLSMEASLSLVFSVLYLIRKNNINEKEKSVLFLLLITPLFLMHSYAIYLLIASLICFSIFLKLELRSISFTLILAALTGISLNFLVSLQFTEVNLSIDTFFEFLLCAVLIFIIYSLKRSERFSKLYFANWVEKIIYSKLALILSVILLSCYVASLFLWVSHGFSFDYSSLNIFGYVPILMYPVKLGITGILAIVALIILILNLESRSREITAIAVLILALIASTVFISTLQMGYSSSFVINASSSSELLRQLITSFREERMFELFRIPLALISALVFGMFILGRFKRKHKSLSNYFLIGGLVLLIMISGMASTFLGMKYFDNVVNVGGSSPSGVINNLQNSVYYGGKATIISPLTSVSDLRFSGATAIVTESLPSWLSKSPEFPLFVTRYSSSTPTYVYLDKAVDTPRLTAYSGNYLSHLTDVAQTYSDNNQVLIKEICNSSIPVSSSSSALIIPYDPSTMSVIGPEHLDELNKNTLTSLSFAKGNVSQMTQNGTMSLNEVQINDDSANFNGRSSYIRISGLNASFEELYVNFYFIPLNITQNQVLVSKLDWGSASGKSWEIIQYGDKIALKVSSDGSNEQIVSSPSLLELGHQYNVICEFDGASLSIVVNGVTAISTRYSQRIFDSLTDLTIGAELYKNQPTSFASMRLNKLQILNSVPANNPIFSSYDLLSAIDCNYTSVLSSDPSIGSFKTIILPYDDESLMQTLTATETNAYTRTNIIINGNGYGPFLNLFGSLTNNALNAKGITSGISFNLNNSVEVPVILPFNNVQTLARYKDSDGTTSPMIMVLNEEHATLIYVNIYPFLSKNHLGLESSQLIANALLPYLEQSADSISDWFDTPSLLFTNCSANGTIRVASESIASINLPENKTINSSNLGPIIIDTLSITIQGGHGFYTVVTANDPLITLQGSKPMSINISGNATFLLRQPKITVNGEISFENFYMMHPPTIYTDGRTTTINGNLVLNVYASDKYTIALPYHFLSPIKVNYQMPLMEFDELASFKLVIPYLVLTIILFIPIVLLLFSKKFND